MARQDESESRRGTGELLVQAIVQVDPVRGWRYLDDAGKVMNLFEDRFKTKRVTIEGLRMSDPESGPIDQVQVSPKMIWASFELPDTTRVVLDHSVKLVTDVSTLLDVTEFKRVAIRMTFIVAMDDSDLDRGIASGALFQVPAVRALSLRPANFDVATSSPLPNIAQDASVTIRIQKATRAPEASPKLPPGGVLLDFDVYREPEKGGIIPLVELRRFAASAIDWLESNIATAASAIRADGPDLSSV